ncbi:uncharacterized protein LOC130649089 [Hydractinia symbiolongicarpus]|uniref:uncharacterized protein LOC130649089 n=1 Tax=Hydractinia symbiolongicarpus TaxID=13093 RepID=UPI00254E38CA|nr:uncharacterized protein LOC130649089 [Hydractinia symbiolongicarpus]
MKPFLFVSVFLAVIYNGNCLKCNIFSTVQGAHLVSKDTCMGADDACVTIEYSLLGRRVQEGQCTRSNGRCAQSCSTGFHDDCKVKKCCQTDLCNGLPATSSSGILFSSTVLVFGTLLPAVVAYTL